MRRESRSENAGEAQAGAGREVERVTRSCWREGRRIVAHAYRTRTRKAARALTAPKNAPQPGKARKGQASAMTALPTTPPSSLSGKSAQQTTAAISPPASSQRHPESQKPSPQNPLLEPASSSNREECSTQQDRNPFAPPQQESETSSRASDVPPPSPWKHTTPPSCSPADSPAGSSPEETRLAGSPPAHA